DYSFSGELDSLNWLEGLGTLTMDSKDADAESKNMDLKDSDEKSMSKTGADDEALSGD
ncbi:unnamed protein product, partial [Heterosigma akashiwo]